MRLRKGTIGLEVWTASGDMGATWERGLFFAYDWTDSTAQDLSSQPVALLPGCALSPCSVAAICRPWWVGQDQ